MLDTNVALPYLTDDEIRGICEPLVSASAQLRHLKKLGLFVVQKPNGKPLLARTEFERVLGSNRIQNQTTKKVDVDIAAIRQRWSR